MRGALVLLVIAMFAAGCGKKPAPASAKSPPPAEETKDTSPAESADDDAGGGGSAPGPTGADPCEGGEAKRKP